MKQEKIKRPIKAPQNDEDFWVDVHDDAQMVELGIRPPSLAPRDPSVWTKTPYEKRILKSLRRIHKGRMHFHSSPIKHIPVRARLIVQLKHNKKFPKSTYSSECNMHEIGSILSKYYQWNKKNKCTECLIVKYSYNGKTYKPWERPFWPGA